ncbi:MAG TPA: ribbon-helix-helix domain-containing protein [Bryobacteraceae bacterium]|nr:ribbon-helix-helix domain-containing protein [Bryobacteraceae bacterium]
MATTKVTFTLDRVSIQRLQDAADQLAVPKSEIIREAIMDFYDRLGRLSERERAVMLRNFDEMVPKIAPRSNAAVDREIAQIRQARRTGGRRTPSGRP